MSVRDSNNVVARLSRRRYGVIYRRELEAHLRAGQLRSCVRLGLLERVNQHVFVNPSIPRSPLVDLAVAIGTAGAAWGAIAAAGHRSACATWAVIQDFPAVPEVVVPVNRRIQRDGFVLFRASDLVRDHIVLHRGLLVPNPMVSVMYLAAVEGPSVVAEAIVRASKQRRFRPKAIELLLRDRAANGRDGITTLRAALQQLPVGDRPPESVIELWFWRIAQQHSLPEMTFQQKVEIGGRRFFIDFALADIKLAIEIDDYETHGTLCGFVHDRGRRNLLVLDGWTVLQFTWQELRDEPGKVAAQVLEAFRKLGVAA